MVIKTKHNKGDAVKWWDSSFGWRYGTIQKIKITIARTIPDIQYVVDFSDETNPKDIRGMKEYQLLRLDEYDY